MRLRTLFMLVVVLALVATACGGDGAVDETTTSAVDSGQTTTTTTEATTTTTEATTTTSSEGGSSAALAGLRDSLKRSSEATKGRMEGSMTVSGIPDLPGGSLSIPFSGAFDNDAGSFSFIMDMTAMASQFGEDVPPEMAGFLGEMEIRTIGDTSYIRFPFFSLFLGAETEWIAVPAEEGADAADFAGGAAPGNPGDLLESLEDANGTVEELGREEIRGVETTHYLVIFDVEELLENATPEERAELEAELADVPIDELPMDIWIGDDGLVYKYVIEMDGSGLPEGEAFESMRMEFEMYDYGEDIVIEPPEEYTELDSLDFGFPAPPTDT